jgi:hypothetical protein
MSGTSGMLTKLAEFNTANILPANAEVTKIKLLFINANKFAAKSIVYPYKPGTSDATATIATPIMLLCAALQKLFPGIFIYVNKNISNTTYNLWTSTSTFQATTNNTYNIVMSQSAAPNDTGLAGSLSWQAW